MYQSPRLRISTNAQCACSVIDTQTQQAEDDGACFLKSLVRKENHPRLVPPSLLRKYLSYAHRLVNPKLSSEAAAVLKDFYLSIRKSQLQDDVLPVTTRQLESAIRLSEARAKAELRCIVTKRDAEDVIAIMSYCMFECFRERSVQPNGAIGSVPRPGGKAKGKTAMVKEFVAELMRVSGRTGECNFSADQLNQMYQAMYQNGNVTVTVTFTDLVDALNHHGYVIRKPGNIYKLCIT